MNRYLSLFTTFLIIFVVVLTLKNYLNLNCSEYANPSFLFNYLGVLLGFGLTLYTFIVSQYEIVERRIHEKYSKKSDVENKIQAFIEVCSEVKDDVFLVFLILLFIIIISVIPNDITIITPINEIVEVSLVTCFILSLLAIKDLIFVSFKLADFIGVNVKKNRQ